MIQFIDPIRKNRIFRLTLLCNGVRDSLRVEERSGPAGGYDIFINGTKVHQRVLATKKELLELGDKLKGTSR